MLVLSQVEAYLQSLDLPEGYVRQTEDNEGEIIHGWELKEEDYKDILGIRRVNRNPVSFR